MNEPSTEIDTIEISKSQRKREAHELLDLAKQLISMPETRLKALPMDEPLREEVMFCRNIRAHGARKRQMMTIGKMLRKQDNEALLDAVNNVDQNNRKMNARFHHIELWRDRLIEGSNETLSIFLEQYPTDQAQTVRQLIRNAQKELKSDKPPAAARKLFKLLRELDTQQQLPPLP